MWCLDGKLFLTFYSDFMKLNIAIINLISLIILLVVGVIIRYEAPGLIMA